MPSHLNANYGSSALKAAKDRIRIPEVAATLFPGWKPEKCCHSPFRQDGNPSFSVFDDNRRWNDFATGERGDVVDFLVKAEGITPRQAACKLIEMSGANRCTILNRTNSLNPGKALEETQTVTRQAVSPLSGKHLQVWDEGVEHLAKGHNQRTAIETSRSWPRGSLARLIERRLIGLPLISGKRQIAFAVQLPELSQTGSIHLTTIGFHLRREPPLGERSSWTFIPSGAQLPALPFCLGNHPLSTPSLVVVCEGQWDAITLAIAGNWLVHDRSWPAGMVAFGLRGANTWRTFLAFWRPLWRNDARVIVFPDADAAGQQWEAPHGLVSVLKQRHRVDVLNQSQAEIKDLNDLYRQQPFGPETVAEWLNPIF